MWRLCHNGLPTKKRLELSHVFLPLDCVFCNAHDEDVAHIFSRCPLVRDVFEDLSRRLNLPSPDIIEENGSFIEFLDSLKRNAQ